MTNHALESQAENDEKWHEFEALLCENRLLRARERTAHYGFVALAQATLLTEALSAATSREEAFFAIELLFGALLAERGVTIYEIDGDFARPVATHGEGACYKPLNASKDLLRQALNEGCAVFDDKAEQRGFDQKRGAEPESTLIVLLRAQDDVLGVVSATVSRMTLPPPPLDILDVFGRRAGEALDRVSFPSSPGKDRLRIR